MPIEEYAILSSSICTSNKSHGISPVTPSVAVIMWNATGIDIEIDLLRLLHSLTASELIINSGSETINPQRSPCTLERRADNSSKTSSVTFES